MIPTSQPPSVSSPSRASEEEIRLSPPIATNNLAHRPTIESPLPRQERWKTKFSQFFNKFKKPPASNTNIAHGNESHPPMPSRTWTSLTTKFSSWRNRNSNQQNNENVNEAGTIQTTRSHTPINLPPVSNLIRQSTQDHPSQAAENDPGEYESFLLGNMDQFFADRGLQQTKSSKQPESPPPSMTENFTN